MADWTTAAERGPAPASMLVVPPMLCQRAREKLKIELPSVAEGDSRMLRPQMIKEVQNLTLRAITVPRELPRDHGNVVPAILDQFVHQASFITCRAVTAHKRAQRWVHQPPKARKLRSSRGILSRQGGAEAVVGDALNTIPTRGRDAVITHDWDVKLPQEGFHV